MSKKPEFVDIPLRGDGKTLPVRVYQSNGAIAITSFITLNGKAHPTQRTLTHLPTGRSIATYLTRTEAKRVYAEAEKACDWSKVTLTNVKRRVPKAFLEYVQSGAYMGRK